MASLLPSPPFPPSLWPSHRSRRLVARLRLTPQRTTRGGQQAKPQATGPTWSSGQTSGYTFTHGLHRKPRLGALYTLPLAYHRLNLRTGVTRPIECRSGTELGRPRLGECRQHSSDHRLNRYFAQQHIHGTRHKHLVKPQYDIRQRNTARNDLTWQRNIKLVTQQFRSAWHKQLI